MKTRTVIVTFVIMIGLSSTIFSQINPFISSDFKIPETFENQYFRLRILTVNDVVKDYDAVMTSIEHLQGVFGPKSKWPSKDLTLEQDLIDLGWHQKEFQIRSSFTYTVVTLDENQVIGCVYIFPTTKGDFNSTVEMWVRASVLDAGLDNILYKSVKQWISEEWSFKMVAYPGRDISWEEWELLK